MRALMVFMLASSFLGFLATFLIQSAYEAKSTRVQLVSVDTVHPSRFGPTTKDVGDPLPMIVTDSGAILKNKTAMGLSMIDRDYVRSHPGSALTVEQILNVPKVARLGCLTAMILGVAGLLLLSRALQPILPYDSER